MQAEVNEPKTFEIKSKEIKSKTEEDKPSTLAMEIKDKETKTSSLQTNEKEAIISTLQGEVKEHKPLGLEKGPQNPDSISKQPVFQFKEDLSNMSVWF